MLNVPVEIQNVIKNDATLKNFRVHFPNGERADLTNDDIVFESVSFTESVCSNDVFKFGMAEASVIEFEMVGVENIIGKTIECSMEYAVPDDLHDTYGEWYSIPYGAFVVDSCPRNHQNMTHRRVVGYSMLLSNITDASNFEALKSAIFDKSNIYRPVVWRFMSAITQNDTNLVDKESLTLSNWGGSTAPVSVMYQSDDNPNVYFSVEFNCRTRSKYHTFVSEYVASPDFNDLCCFDYEFDKDLYEESVGALNGIIELLNEGFEGYHVVDGTSLDYLIRIISRYIEYIKPTIDYFQDYNHDGSGIGKYIRFDPLSFDENNGVRTSQLFYPYRSNAGFRTVSIEIPYEIDASFTIGLAGYDDIVFDTVFADSISLKSLDKTNKTSLDNMTFSFRSTLQSKMENTNVYSFINAYSVRDIMADWAELNCAFVHSERDGSISVEPLDNSNPYQLELSDIEGSAWWDEYDVNPIGVIKYTFYNPLTDTIASGSYEFNPDSKSVYDLSGNTVLESIDFNIKKAGTVSAMTDKSSWYLYTGSEEGYSANNFYYYDGAAWVSGGRYSNATSLVEFVISQVFIPNVNTVNFTPVEMNIRGLPFLEAGDAFTLTVDGGTVLNSYILNHTFDGIQHISESITSVSGEIIK